MLRFILIFLFVVATPFFVRAQQPKTATEQEYRNKLEYILRFAEDIEWPAGSPVYDPSKPFVIATLGGNPFGQAWNALVYHKIKGKQVKVLNLKNLSEVENVDLLFVAKEYEAKAYFAAKVTDNTATLTIGDSRAMSSQNIIISFVSIDNEVRFHINTQIALEHGFMINSKLLRMSR